MARLPKKPKRPRAGAGLGVWERFDQRVREWHQKVSKIKSDKKKKESLIKKHSR